MQEKSYCVMTLEKVHSMANLQIRHEHNFREIELKHVDSDLSDNNRELVNASGMDYKDLWYRRMKDLELKHGKPVVARKNAVLAYEIVTTFTRGANVDVDAWAAANKKWMEDTFGAENVLSMQLHLDETTPHIHTIVIPIDERDRLCAKTFTGGKAKMKHLHNTYGKAMEPLGLSRGERYSRTKKEDLGRFYAQVNKAAKAHAPTMEANEPVESYVQRVNRYIQDIEMETLYEKKKWKRYAELQQTKTAQMYAHYSEAIKLQDQIDENCGHNYPLIKNRLQTYQRVEQAVPRKTLNGLLENILIKFKISENVRAARAGKKKKRDFFISEEGTPDVENR